MSEPRSVALGPGREFDAIRTLLERWGHRAQGIGDDAAVLDVPEGERVVVSTDTAVEGVHFRRDWLTPTEIGWRAAAAATSDLAAMAARPLGIVIAIALPTRWRAALPEIAEGLGDACGDFGIPIVGGNLSAAGELSITSTVIGSAARPIARSGARPGDVVYVTGRLGGPASALDALASGAIPEPRARDRLAHPVPRLAEARWLAERGARSMIDISDGLVADLGHIAAASGVRITVDAERIPVLGGVSPSSAAGGGEEFELAVTAPELDVDEFERAFGLPLTAVGKVKSGSAEAVLIREGVRVASPPGHDHLSR